MHRSLPLLLAVAATAQAQDLRHARPERDAEVPISGWPTYAENLTIGSPIADHGSHAGVKATVTRDDPIAAEAFLNAAHYSGFQVVGAQVDQSLVYVVEDGRARLAPPARRQVEFHPWGWEEVARGDDLEARGAVTTLATDAFLITAKIVNRGAVPRTLAPRLALVADGDGVHEGMHPLHMSWIKRWKSEHDRDRSAVVIDFRRGTVIAPLAWDRQRFFRTVASDLPIERVRRGLEPFARSPSRWSTTIELAARTVAPGQALEVSFLIGCGAKEDEATAVLERNRAALGDGRASMDRVRAQWDRDLAALPRPHAANADEARLFQMAYTGLRMNRYAARGELTGTMNTAAKMHFNAFYVWDVALAALAESNWDPALGREMLQELFRAQLPEGHLHYAVDAERRPVSGFIRGTSQPPVHGWVVDRILERGGTDRAWLEEVYRGSAEWLEFFQQRRDKDTNGLYGFANALETGWDDTPRYPGVHFAPELNIFGNKLVLGNLSGLLPASGVDALDLNCWLVSYYRAMARWGETLGKPAAEVAEWRRRADELTAKIDAELWDPVTRTYRDTTRGPNGTREHVRVDTPVVAWPLFLGVSRDRERIRSTIEGYLLDPARAFGNPDDPARPFFPVPSVAYDDPAYDHENDGYYWRGQSWLLPAYAAVEALYKHGYEAESRELKARILRAVVKASPGGIYETYDARTGEIGFGSGSMTGVGEPAAFLIGLSCAPVAELLLDRHERERLVSPEDRALSGFVHEARELSSDRLLYQVARSDKGFLPRTSLRARGGASLLASTAGLELELTDPPGNLTASTVRVTLAGKRGWTAWGVPASGPARPLASSSVGDDLQLVLMRTDAGTFTRYVIMPPGASP